jgi:hypothetical protein
MGMMEIHHWSGNDCDLLWKEKDITRSNDPGCLFKD